MRGDMKMMAVFELMEDNDRRNETYFMMFV